MLFGALNAAGTLAGSVFHTYRNHQATSDKGRFRVVADNGFTNFVKSYGAFALVSRGVISPLFSLLGRVVPNKPALTIACRVTQAVASVTSPWIMAALEKGWAKGVDFASKFFAKKEENPAPTETKTESAT